MTYIFTTWNPLRSDDIRLYVSTEKKIYGKRYGLPLKEYSTEWAMYLAWMHINRTCGWPQVWDPKENTHKITISKEAMDADCKKLLCI